MTWTIEEIESVSGKPLAHLSRVGAASADLLCRIATKLEDYDSPHVACFFQLPYPVSVEEGYYRSRTATEGIIAEVKAELGIMSFNEKLECSIVSSSQNEYDDDIGPGIFPVTQMVMIMPLWGARANYYNKYERCISASGFKDRIVVSNEESWIGRPMKGSDFEHNICQRLPREILLMLRRFLPAYSLLSLCEAPIPTRFCNYFVMTAPGRISFNATPQPTIAAVSNTVFSLPALPLPKERFQAALLASAREPTMFEQQLYAMNRLRAQGETALALIGVLSLLEWFIDLSFPWLREKPNRVPSLSYLLKKTNAFGLVPEGIKTVIEDSISIRDQFVHGAPPVREKLTLQLGAKGGTQRPTSDLSIIDKTIHAAADVFRVVNLQRLKESSSLPDVTK